MASLLSSEVLAHFRLCQTLRGVRSWVVFSISEKPSSFSFSYQRVVSFLTRGVLKGLLKSYPAITAEVFVGVSVEPSFKSASLAGSEPSLAALLSSSKACWLLGS